MAMRPDFPLPDTDWEPTREFWAAAARGQLVIPRCGACGAYCWYPERTCPACRAESFRWAPMSGRGRLFSWAVVRHAFLPQFAEEIPYVSGLVALEEDPGVRLVTRIVGAEPPELEFDMAMRVVFAPLRFPGVEREVMAPFFTPALTAGSG